MKSRVILEEIFNWCLSSIDAGYGCPLCSGLDTGNRIYVSGGWHSENCPFSKIEPVLVGESNTEATEGAEIIRRLIDANCAMPCHWVEFVGYELADDAKAFIRKHLDATYYEEDEE